ncbi:MAG: hypothetical protein V1860_03100 [bacterium]
MNNNIIKIQDGVIVLPKKIQRYWQGASIYFDAGKDFISIKRLSKPNLTFDEMLDEFSDAARKTKLFKKDVNQTLKKIRSKA